VLVLGAGLAATPAAAQTLTPLVNLSFGAFVAGSGGTVVVGTSGSRSKTGTVVLVGQGAGVAASLFNVQGSADATVSISLPADGVVTLADGDGHTLAVNGFVASPSGSVTLSGGGTRSLAVGATLVVGNRQPRGSYSGSFSVTVNYQ
jgi:Domain of unknown function (DUF4402)